MKKMAKRIKQIGMVVADIEKAIEHWRSLGAGEFRRFFLSSSRNTCGEVFKNGKPHLIESSMAVADFNGIQIELMQPLDDQSIYYDFLKESGEGLHHLCFDTDDTPFDEVNSYMEKRYGAPIFNGIGALTQFAYYDCRKEMGLFIEVVTKKPE